MEKYTRAEALVEFLNANGIDTIFFNPGIDSSPVQAVISQKRSAKEKSPRLILCLHESVAMSACIGHYMVSGHPQLVMVHGELGTLQIGGAIHNAQWARVPAVLMAGFFPQGERVNWQGEPYDQGYIVRNNVKWDHEIRPDENIQEVLQKAFQIACTEPCGPVYLYYPFLYLASEAERSKTPLRFSIPSPAPIADEKITQIADELIKSENPLIVTGYAGRHPQMVESMVELAETLCAPVLTGQVWMNFPTTHPLCAGIEQILGSRKGNTCLTEADTILVVDYDLAYAVAEGLPGQKTRILQIDSDRTTQGRLLWDRGADVFIQGDSRQVIPTLTKIIRQKLTPEQRTAVQNRFKRIKSSYQKQKSEWKESGRNSSKKKSISPDWLCYCLNQVMDENMILVNHTISHSASVTEQIERTRPGTLLSCAAGSISWAPGAALGAKVAAPDRTVVSVMTDGGFVWGCPVAALWSSNAYQSPFLSIVFNNRGYGVMKRIVTELSGGSPLSEEREFEAGTTFNLPPDYGMISQSCGGFGKKVQNPEDVLPALKEAMSQVQNGKSAVLDVWLGEE
jgi:acetolactate synthase I/II/III large subunit